MGPRFILKDCLGKPEELDLNCWTGRVITGCTVLIQNLSQYKDNDRLK